MNSITYEIKDGGYIGYTVTDAEGNIVDTCYDWNLADGDTWEDVKAAAAEVQ